MALNGSNQIQKNRPVILQDQAEPADSDLAPGEFAIFPKVKDGKVELHTKSKDSEGVVTPATNLTTDGGAAGDDNGTWTQYVHTVNTTQAAAKKFTLNPAPRDVGGVSLTPVGGMEQVSGDDFEVINDDELSWSGKGLDGEVSAGDKFLLKYFS